MVTPSPRQVITYMVHPVTLGALKLRILPPLHALVNPTF